MNRRQLLQLAACGGLAGLAVSRTLAAASCSVAAVLFDSLYPACGRYVVPFRAAGVPVIDLHACDVVRLWRGPLAQHWRSHPLPIAGLCSYPDFLLLKGCARERGLDLLWHERMAEAGSTLHACMIGYVTESAAFTTMSSRGSLP